MMDLAETIRELVDSRSEIVLRPLPVDDPRRRCPSIALAARSLGWRPKVPLKMGLAATVAYFRKTLHLDARQAVG